MPPDRHNQVVELVRRLWDLAPSEWAAALDEIPDLEPEVREEVLGLLEADRSTAADPPAGDLRAPGHGVDPSGHGDVPVPSRYRIDDLLDKGGMGEVYSAYDHAMARRVALKILSGKYNVTPPVDAELSSTPGSPTYLTAEAAQFVLEARVAAGLDHGGVLQVHDVGWATDSRPFYTMPLLPKGRTLKSAIRRLSKASFDERRDLIQTLVQICDAVGFAHDRGIVHRDLKPANVMLGEGDQVIVIDWGLAWITADPERLDDWWRVLLLDSMRGPEGRVRSPQGGTPQYMAPERVSEGGGAATPQEDVYALGAMLFEILTGDVPLDARETTPLAVLARDTWPPTHDEIPPSLAEVLAEALERNPELRIQDAGALAGALRDWLHSEGVERLHLGRLASARRIVGDARHEQGRGRRRAATYAVRELQDVPPEFPDREAILEEARALEERGMKEETEGKIRRRTRRARMATVALLALLAVAASWAVTTKRDRDEKAVLLAKVDRLADANALEELADEAVVLWPGSPGAHDRITAWLGKAAGLISRRDLHSGALLELRKRGTQVTEAHDARGLDALDTAALQADVDDLEIALEDPALDDTTRKDLAGRRDRARRQLASSSARSSETWIFDAPEDRWRHAVLVRILRLLEDLDPTIAPASHGLVARLRTRLDAVRPVADAEECEQRWRRVVARVGANPRYRGVAFERDTALIPLGPDATSTLEEFFLRGTGRQPERIASGLLTSHEDDGIVLVLLPGGTSRRGTHAHTAPDGAATQADEQPVRDVEILPVLMGKYELTQEQWAAMTEGGRPSHERKGARGIGSRHPVESVTWEEARTWLGRYGLRLPYEAEWEYACRAGTRDVRHVPEGLAMDQFANFADATLGRKAPPAWRMANHLDDGHHFHAPVGLYLPNPFGLHDTYGNVAEWCTDMYDEMYYAYSRRTQPRGSTARFDTPEAITRGGSWRDHPDFLRSADRRGLWIRTASRFVGIRPARDP